MNEKIAIIGLSGIYPQADDLVQFHQNLASAVDSVREVPVQRKIDVGLEATAKCQLAAMLDRVDQFDHAFFRISLKEAECMDPHQRLLLKLACSAIENAGYGLSYFRGSKTAVYISASGGGYSRLIQGFEASALTGTLPAALAGRIAYTLDLRGPTMVVDTACSSSLVAVIQACRSLLNHEANFALAGGVNVFFLEDQLDSARVEIIAPDGRSKAFDAAANGAGWGEGGGLLLLRPLQAAIENHDIIHAVLNLGAINQDGARSNGLAAPSPDAQSEVILEAWQNAGVQPEDLSYIEAHGTGTKLGDPIEIEGITKAFRHHGEARQLCAIGSVKTNIGHLVGAAGIAGLTKIVLSLQHKQLFPSLHFSQPNPYIDFSNSPVAVNTNLRSWEVPPGKKRQAGISSFGLSGTNAHLVVEEAPAVLARSAEPTQPAPVLMKLSAQSPPALRRYQQTVLSFLQNSKEALTDIAYTLNTGRDDYECRYVQVLKTREEAMARLQKAQSEDCKPVKNDASLVLLLAGDVAVDATHISDLVSRYSAFAEARSRCSVLPAAGIREEEQFAFLYGICALWRSLGLTFSNVIGTGIGNLALKVFTGKMNLRDAWRELPGATLDSPVDSVRLKNVVKAVSEAGRPVFIEAGRTSCLSRAISGLTLAQETSMVCTLSENKTDSVLAAIAELYRQGVGIEWNKLYPEDGFRRVPVPTYPFDAVRCWVTPRSADKTPAASDTPSSGELVHAYGALAEQGSAFEKGIARIWGDVLKRKVLSLDDDYFEAGGNSLDGMQVLNRIEDEFGVRLEFEQFYEFPTVRAVAGEVARRQSQTASKEESTQTSPLRPKMLSSGQERLWFLQQLQPESGFYNLSFGLSIRGELNTAGLQRALDEIYRRHESLRTVFPSEDHQPVQQILPVAEVSIQRRDVSAPSIEIARKQSIEIACEESRRPFDLTNGPLWRVILVRVADNEQLLVVVMHHIISDAWSIGVLVRELAVLYDSHVNQQPPKLPELRMQYAEHAQMQRSLLKSQAHKQEIEYWTSTLAGMPANLDLPYDFQRPLKRDSRGARFTFHLDDELIHGLGALSNRENVTLFMILLAAFQTLLARYSGQDDICVGIPVAGRDSSEIENLIGFFVNTLVLRADLSGNPAFRTLLRRVRKAVISAFSHQKAPFDEVVQALQLPRSLDHHALFQVMFMVQNIEMEVVQVPGLEWNVLDVENGSAQFDMVFALLENQGRFSGRVDYNTDLFQAATIERMVKHFKILLKGILTDPDAHIRELPLLTLEEQLTLGMVGRQEAVFSKDTSFSHYFEAQAECTPEAVALVYEGRRWTYRQLNEQANQLAEYLSRYGVGPEVAVGVAVGRSAEMVIGLLGILKTGAAYLPLDVDYPAERLKYMIRDGQAKVILVREQERSKLESECIPKSVRVIDIDQEHDAISSCCRANPGIAIHANATAYVIYTSGSTGAPKGVMVTHGSLTNFAVAMSKAMQLRSDDRVLQFASVSFDASAVQIYPALLQGAAVVLHPTPNRLSNQELLAFTGQEGITVLDLPGAFWRQWIEDPGVQQGMAGTAIRLFMTGGESVPWQKLKLWGEVAPYGSRFLSSYGPTECTVTTTIFTAGKDDLQVATPDRTNISLGLPLENTRIYVLDQHLQSVPFGCLGTVYVGGAGVARGYIQHAELTASRFLPDPFSAALGARMYCTGDMARHFADGSIQFVGRMDEQVKIRGFRVEIEEVEAILQKCPEVSDAAVVAKRGPDGGDRLVAYLTPAEVGEFSSFAVKAFMRSRLPEFMVPAQFVFLDSMPLTVNGKIDRSALPEQNQPDSTAGESPRTAMEQRLAELWCEVLGIAEAGRDANFFDLGGHSLLATRLVSRIREVFQLEIPLRDVFEFPTVAEFAHRMKRASEASELPIRKVARTGPLPLSFAQQRLWFFEQLEPSVGRFNIPNVVHMSGSLNFAALKKSVQELVNRHESLRTVFPVENGTPSQLVFQEIQIDVPMTDLRNYPERQKARARDQIIEAELHFPFELQRGPLMRAHLLWMDQDEYVLLMNFHHIIFDGWSLGVLIDDLVRLYRAFSADEEPVLPELPFQYIDYACWQRERLTGALLDDHLQFWKSHLLNAPATLQLPQHTVKKPWAGGARYTFSISAPVVSALQTISNQERTTLFVASLAAFSIALFSYTGQDDMVIGAAASNRTHAELEHLIGCFFNQMPLRVQLTGNPTFRELVSRVSQVSFDAFAHQEMPFDLLVQHLQPERTGAGSPLFQVLFVYQNMPLNKVELPGMTLTLPEVGSNEVKFDFSMFLKPEDGCLHGVVEYHSGLFSRETAEDIVQHYLDVLDSVVGNPDHNVRLLASAATSEPAVAAGAFNDSLS